MDSTATPAPPTTTAPAATACGFGTAPCRTDGCFLLSDRCNGVPNCDDGSDEELCPVTAATGSDSNTDGDTNSNGSSAAAVVGAVIGVLVLLGCLGVAWHLAGRGTVVDQHQPDRAVVAERALATINPLFAGSAGLDADPEVGGSAPQSRGRAATDWSRPSTGSNAMPRTEAGPVYAEALPAAVNQPGNSDGDHAYDEVGSGYEEPRAEFEEREFLHGALTRKEAERLLAAMPEGAFLVREKDPPSSWVRVWQQMTRFAVHIKPTRGRLCLCM